MTGLIDARFRGKLGRFDLDVAFDAPARGVTALFGPSGCGKTSVLRCMAGLTRIADGFLSIDGEIWQDGAFFRPTHRRALGYVFQDANLFPHLSVRDNLLYGAPRDRTLWTIPFDETIALLGVEPLLDRAPLMLSGGERQRVAIGRALLSQPKLLLMDEPLSALDRLTKDEILPYLERLHESLSIPVIYVSHDIGEIEQLADRLVLMQAGRVLSSGPIGQLQTDAALALPFLSEAAVSLDAVVESFDAADGLAGLRVDGARLLAPAARATPGEARRIRIHAADISLARQRPLASTILNVTPARIVSARESGRQITAVLGLGENGEGARLLCRVTLRSWRTLELATGQSVFAQIKAVSLARRGD